MNFYRKALELVREGQSTKETFLHEYRPIGDMMFDRLIITDLVFEDTAGLLILTTKGVQALR